jgi:hypothetical protein
MISGGLVGAMVGRAGMASSVLRLLVVLLLCVSAPAFQSPSSLLARRHTTATIPLVDRKGCSPPRALRKQDLSLLCMSKDDVGDDYRRPEVEVEMPATPCSGSIRICIELTRTFLCNAVVLD